MDMHASNGQEQALSPLLEPSSHLEQLVKGKGLAFTEYRLTESPPTIQEFGSLFVKQGVDENLFVWTTPCAFVGRTVSGPQNTGFLVDRYLQIQVFLSNSGGDSYLYFLVFSPTLEDAMQCLVELLHLPDRENTQVSVWGKEDPSSGGEMHPFSEQQLELILREERRRVLFRETSFTVEKARVLAEHGKNLEFSECSFSDGGRAFVETFRGGTSVVALCFYSHIPFAQSAWLNFLELLRERVSLCRLELWMIDFDEATCTALASASVTELKLNACKFEDKGTALTEAIAHGRGPRGLRFDFAPGRRPFETEESWIAFMQAVGRERSRIECLSFMDTGVEDIVWGTLASSLHTNRSLFRLSFCSIMLSFSVWKDVVMSLSNHTTLCSLSFQSITFYDHVGGVAVPYTDRTSQTNVLVEMLKENTSLKSLTVGENMRDPKLWRKQVMPQLEYNEYREKLSRLQNENHMRGAVIAKALVRLQGRSSLSFAVLTQNQELLVSYIAAK